MNEQNLLGLATLAAIIIGPVLSVQISRLLDRKKNQKDGKLAVFKSLMRTRASTLSTAHVEALNMIDVEFHGGSRKDKAVISAWKLYLDNLGDTITPDDIKIARRSELFVDLLHMMATSLDYDFDKEHIKNTSYVPQAYIDIENEQLLLRRGVIGLLDGKLVLPVKLVSDQKD